MVVERTKPMTGGCMCGAIRYEASESPIEVYYCHCRVCQRAAGNVVGTWAQFPARAFRFTRGGAKFHRSSDVAERGFCGNCGTQLVAMGFEADEPNAVAVGSLDHPEGMRPEGHFGVESKVPWFNVQDDLPHTRTEDIPDFVPPKKLFIYQAEE
jgi:hypothetical protein